MSKTIYVCPETNAALELVVEKEGNGVIQAGYFKNPEGEKYAIKNGFPDFTYPRCLTQKQEEQYNYYETNADAYDTIQGVTFDLHREDEDKVRKDMVSQLQLKPNSKVLELSCGTGRDSVNIAAHLSKGGELFVQDISGSMLQKCRDKLQSSEVPVDYSIGNASYLAFPDNHFDATFSFGGLNVYEDLKRSLAEMVRVTKPGGRIVVGDESLPLWLYETEFGKTLLNANPLFKFKVPYESIPVEARDVTVKWIIGGVYYLISFTVGEGEPKGNFDLEIPGKRGGTLNTRYHGQLEGVSQETKKLVRQAAEKNKVSVHKWLDQVLKSEAEKQIN
jgi:ubiquinone/menaquinone biosynthesis C-methylase UbiE